MKYTGWAVLILGVLIGVYGLFSSMPTSGAVVPPSQADGTPAPVPFPLGTVLLAFSALAIAGGLAILLFGGRGVIKTKDLSVRN